jgi:hypothetical protein
VVYAWLVVERVAGSCRYDASAWLVAERLVSFSNLMALAKVGWRRKCFLVDRCGASAETVCDDCRALVGVLKYRGEMGEHLQWGFTVPPSVSV